MTSVGSYALTTIKICIHDIIDNVIGQKEAKSSHTTVTKYTNLLYVRYVRRELRSLTDADREDFLDALKTLYDVDTVTGTYYIVKLFLLWLPIWYLLGQSRYGSSYKSLYYFVSIHVDGAGNPVCDEFHTGEGFFSNHVLLSNYLEQVSDKRKWLLLRSYRQMFSLVITAYQSSDFSTLFGICSRLFIWFIFKSLK